LYPQNWPERQYWSGSPTDCEVNCQVDLLPLRFDLRELEASGIAIGRTQAQYILSAMPGSTESAPNGYYRQEARKQQD